MARKYGINLERKKGLYLKSAGIKGRGLFCRTNIKAGEILEVTPALILNEKATELVDKTILRDYAFVTGTLTKTLRKKANLKKTGDASSIVFGVLTFCNHSKKPNAEILLDERGGTLYYMLHTTKAIPKDTEICTSYGDGWFDDRK